MMVTSCVSSSKVRQEGSRLRKKEEEEEEEEEGALSGTAVT